ncbi:TAP-like protein-domain-containing protein [Microdochium bolleyi]|uniref:TAP-like protein-domain-containing protein n=1 Tax=Microdochium bolleyi TaxID=196109 RepID=A0A136IU46_9PEZI|nr:TAP-like protein-domain-containing protein [Microdochium bolleyi]
MHPSTSRTSLLVLPLAATAVLGTALPRAEQIQWGECHIETNTTGLPVQCGKLSVPLDWSGKASDKTIELELIKWPAAKQPAPKGSILLNFGGPGGDGLNNFIGNVPLQAPIIGDEHDLISWDPRGTRNTIPVICLESPPLNPDLLTYMTDWHNASDTTPAQLWAESSVLAQLCKAKLQEIGPYVGMASVSRDMMAIVDALGEDGLLRYWGISGGTALGATVAAMFPERMDKVILDGVMNVHQYYNSLVETELISNADDILRGIFEACLEAGPKACPLASHGATCADLESKMDQLLLDLKYDQIPAVYLPLSSGLVVDYSMVLNWLFPELYTPRRYDAIVKVLEGLFRRDATAFIEVVLAPLLASSSSANTSTSASTSTPSAAPSAAPIVNAVWGIRCGDRRPRAASRQALEPEIAELEARSRWFAHFGLGTNSYLCAQWPSEAAERYAGDFTGVKTRNPVLFVGNTFDPVTPLRSAHNMSSGFEGSVVLQHDSYGHVSFYTQRSNCTDLAIHEYLSEGKLPAKDTVCKPNSPIIDYVTGKV